MPRLQGKATGQVARSAFLQCGQRRSVTHRKAGDGALRGARPRAVHALAAPIARAIALMALAALGVTAASFHEPFHTERSAACRLATVRDILGAWSKLWSPCPGGPGPTAQADPGPPGARVPLGQDGPVVRPGNCPGNGGTLSSSRGPGSGLPHPRQSTVPQVGKASVLSAEGQAAR
jgi:hypothetical protein